MRKDVINYSLKGMGVARLRSPGTIPPDPLNPGLPPARAKDKSEWSYTFIPPYVWVVLCSVKIPGTTLF
jgi:hypothetical protein